MKNVVFDLGGVLFDWNPNKIIDSFTSDKKLKKIIKKEIFQHNDWIELDRGTLEFDSAINRASRRTNLSEDKVKEIFDLVPTSLELINETLELIKEVEENGNKIFVLSNMHKSSIKYLEENYNFWNIFDGQVISCRIKMVKPEEKIYKYLLSQFALQADETVFIDDTNVNIESADKVGIKTIKFENSYQCRSDLRKLDCF